MGPHAAALLVAAGGTARSDSFSGQASIIDGEPVALLFPTDLV
jgi:hypothetical protein